MIARTRAGVILSQICKTRDELKSERLFIDYQVINFIERNISVSFEIGSATRWAEHFIVRQDGSLLIRKGLNELDPFRLGGIIAWIDINQSPAFPSDPMIVDAWVTSLTNGREPRSDVSDGFVFW